MNCGGYLFKLGEVTATPKRVQLARGERGKERVQPAESGLGRGRHFSHPHRAGGGVGWTYRGREGGGGST